MRNFFFIFLAFGLFTLFCHCSFDIANNQRILVTGRFIDYSGNPIPGIEVSNVSQHNILGSSLSDNNGAYQFYSIVSRNHESSVVVNREESFKDTDSTVKLIPNLKFKLNKYFHVYEACQFKWESLNVKASVFNGKDMSKAMVVLPTLGLGFSFFRKNLYINNLIF